MLRRKLLRDLWRSRGQTIAIVAVIALGCALFTATYLAYLNLGDSYSATQTRLHLADLTLDVTAVSAAQAQQAAAIAVVTAAEPQLQLDVPVLLANGRNQEGGRGAVLAGGRLLSIPLGLQPALDQLIVQAGHYPQQPDEVLVERHFADYHGLRVGDTLQVALPGGPATLRVAGVAVSAEYLWVARSRQDVFPSAATFGVLFVPRPELATLARAALTGAPPATGSSPEGAQAAGLQLAADGQAGNRLLVGLQPGANVTQVTRQLTALLGADAVLATTPRADLVGVHLLQLDVDGLRELAVAFPLLFLIVGSFIVAALLYRRVDSERTVIGMLLALGTRPAAVLRHYVAFGGMIGLIGAVVGTTLGLILAHAFTVAYAQELAIPFVTSRLDPQVLAVAVGMGLVAPLLAGVFPAHRAARLAPAAAMRSFVRGGRTGPARAGGASGHLPLWLRLPVRDISRHPWRSAATAAGVGAALILIVTTGGMLDSTQRGIDLTFSQAQRYDLRVDLLQPQTVAQLAHQIGSQPAVETVEALLTLPVQVRAVGGAQTYATVLQGLPAPSPLLTPLDAGGRPLPPLPGRTVLTRSVAVKLGVRPGDRLEVRLLPSGPTTTVTIGALSDTMIGNAVSMTAGDVATAFGLPDAATTVLLTVTSGRRPEVVAALDRLPDVAQVTDVQELRAQIVTLMGLADVFLGVMVLCGVALAAAILFNTATLSIAERQRELATMRALGERMAGIVRLITLEHGLVALGGLLVGFPVALLCLRLFLGLSSSDLFTLPFWLSPRTVIATLLGVLLVLLAAQWPALRAVAGANLAETAKLRE